ncbi:MAG: sulfatase-like hydrolase/transferase [Planctomycetota bacterium]|nr:sulfatase-like hydrolase/transferase [Planctomycetota bacterium]
MKAGFVALALALLASACGESRPRRSVLLVTLDTTRADALGCYGSKPAVTPQLDALAAEGVCFLNARTVTPATLPAHASMLTGLYPVRHRVRDNGLNALPRAATSVAELAQSHGLQTAAFVSAAVLDRAFGLDQGFVTYTQPPRESDVVGQTGYTSVRADETAAAARDWLTKLDGDADFFLWVHFFDPHRPWVADPRFLERAGGNPYLAEVAATDAAVGTLIETLRTSGRLATTTVLVVGDHGEGLGEHGEDAHAWCVYDSTMRVPFLLRRFDGQRKSERASLAVTVADVAPTLLDALALPQLEGVDGMSLWNPIDGERGVYFESYYAYLHYGMAPLVGWADERGKLIHTSVPELYDIATDPGETRNRLPEDAAAAQERLVRIREVLARPTLEAGEDVTADAELLRSVQSLGYAASGSVDAFPDPLESSSRPSPHSQVLQLRSCDAAEVLFTIGRIADAAKAFERIVADNPRNSFALEYLGHCRFRLGDWPGARESFERALEHGPERAAILRALGFVLQRLGDKDAARTRWTRSAELDPRDTETLQFLLQDALELGDAAAEARWRAALRAAAKR